MLISAVPGVESLFVDLVHLAAHGHVTDEPGHEHEHQGDDCCSGLFHLCSCHHNVGGMAPDVYVRVPVAGAELLLVRAGTDLSLPGYRAPPYRPPSV